MKILEKQFCKVYCETRWLLLNLALLVLLHGPNFIDSDEGVILNGAWNLFNGKKLYIDFFEFVPPSSFYLIYATWLFTGVHYWAAQLMGFAFLLLGAAGVQLIALFLMRSVALGAGVWIIRTPALLFCVSTASLPMINHNSFSAVMAIWSCYFLLRAIAQPSWRCNLAAGCLVGVSFSFLQHRGLAMLAGALCNYLILSRGRINSPWLTYAAQFSLAALFVPTVLVVSYSPAVLFSALFTFPAANYWHVNITNPAPLLIAFASLAAISWYLRSEYDRLIQMMITIQLALLIGTIPRPDSPHVQAVIFPMLCLLPRVLAAYLRQRPNSSLSKSSAPMLMMASIFVLGAAARSLALSSFDEPRVIAYVRDNCASSQYLYAGPFVPGIYFETRKLNATRYSVLFPGLNTDEQFREAVADLSTRDVPCVVTNYRVAEDLRYTRSNPIDDYLRDNYSVFLVDGDFRVLKRVVAP